MLPLELGMGFGRTPLQCDTFGPRIKIQLVSLLGPTDRVVGTMNGLNWINGINWIN